MLNRLKLLTNRNIFLLSCFLRVIIPLYILKYPLFGVVAAIFLDTIDVEFASRGVLTLRQYEIVDKVLDTWWYFIALIYSAIYMEQYFLLLLTLFIYRLIGVGWFFWNKNRKTLFFFPAFFEHTFLLLFFSSYFTSLNFLTSRHNFYISLVVVCLIKIAQEFWVHLAQISISEDIFKRKRKWLGEF